jgi:hypothetical protein
MESQLSPIPSLYSIAEEFRFFSKHEPIYFRLTLDVQLIVSLVTYNRMTLRAGTTRLSLLIGKTI